MITNFSWYNIHISFNRPLALSIIICSASLHQVCQTHNYSFAPTIRSISGQMAFLFSAFFAHLPGSMDSNLWLKSLAVPSWLLRS